MRTPCILPATAPGPTLFGRIADHLEGGGLLGYPTETVYGLGASADPVGIAALRALKGREEGKPFLVLIPDRDEVERMGLRWTPVARRLAEAFWPGPVTLILAGPADEGLMGLRGPTGGVAVRVSPQRFVRGLMRARARPLLSTSANVSGEGEARSAFALAAALAERPGVERLWVADAGELPPSAPSTLLDCTEPGAKLVRSGSVGAGALRRIVPDLEDRVH